MYLSTEEVDFDLHSMVSFFPFLRRTAVRHVPLEERAPGWKYSWMLCPGSLSAASVVQPYKKYR